MRGETVTTSRTEGAQGRDSRRWTIRAHHAFDHVVTVERGFDSLEWGERVEVVPASHLDAAVSDEAAQRFRDALAPGFVVWHDGKRPGPENTLTQIKRGLLAAFGEH